MEDPFGAPGQYLSRLEEEIMYSKTQDHSPAQPGQIFPDLKQLIHDIFPLRHHCSAPAA
jgi:hypothetical protein